MSLLAAAAVAGSAPIITKGALVISAAVTSAIAGMGYVILGRKSITAQDKEIELEKENRHQKLKDQLKLKDELCDNDMQALEKARQSTLNNLDDSVNELAKTISSTQNSSEKLKAIISFLNIVSESVGKNSNIQISQLREFLKTLENNCKNLEENNVQLSNQVSGLEDVIAKHQKSQNQLEKAAKLDKETILSLKFQLERAVLTTQKIKDSYKSNESCNIEDLKKQNDEYKKVILKLTAELKSIKEGQENMPSNSTHSLSLFS